MGGMNVRDRNAGFAAGQEQVWGYDKRTGIDSRSYGAPGAKTFYVDPNNTQAVDFGNLGEDPTVPLATVAAAVALCRAYQGDTIVVGANDGWQYAAGVRNTPIMETLVVPSTKGGIRIVGMSTNPLGLVWTPAAAGQAAVTVHATDVLIEGFNFYPFALANCIGILAEWDGATAFGENMTVRNCYFSSDLDYGIQMDYTWYCQIYDSYFDAVGVAAIHNLSVTGDADYAIIHDNDFDNCAIAMNLLTSDNCHIWNNRVNGDGTGANNFIDLTGGADNLVADNWLACTIAQYDVTCSDATSGAWVRNHCIDGDTAANPV